MREEIKKLLISRDGLYRRSDFSIQDPISVPHLFSKKEDIEIAAFFATTLAWGQRKTIIANTKRLLQWMDYAPHQFLLHHQPTDLKPFLSFVHRTYQASDLLYSISRLKNHYQQHPSLEHLFSIGLYREQNIAKALNEFKASFFNSPHLQRTQKHYGSPKQGSACKRICMLLRWMVRKDKAGVDFGLWKNFKTTQLVIPLDTHVAGVSARLGLLPSTTASWKQAVLLTEQLKTLDPNDPVRYDYALFGIGAEERWKKR